METIHVNLVAYCDNELPKTINNIFETAKHPERIFIGCVNQDDEQFEYTGKFKENVKIINITPEESGGYGWCRKLAQDTFFDHDYYFQIAPHSRLLKNWDEKFIEYYKKRDGKHIIVSTPSSYDIDNNTKEFLFFVDGIIEFHPHAVFHYKQTKELKFDNDGMRETMTFFAGCIFASRDWIKDVPYDDKIFLYGEEPDLNLRTFGAGYKAWLIKEEIVWHLWGRKNRKALGHIREKDRYNIRNFVTKKYILEKLLNKGYTKQDEFFYIMGLNYNNLKETYKQLMEIEMDTIKATARFTRVYSTNFRTFSGKEYDVPREFFNKYPTHFTIKMTATSPVKMVVEPNQEIKIETQEKTAVKPAIKKVKNTIKKA